MFSNYLKITFAVLMRRKFLTFVNLFGAAVTMLVLVVGFALLESFLSPSGAQQRQSQILTVSEMMLDGRPATFLITAPGFNFHRDYIAPLETPDKTSFTLRPLETSSYISGRKVTSQLRPTDAAYWEILDFELIEGRVLAADDVDQGRFVAVINEATANTWFPGESALGKTIIANNDTYEVVGVVVNEPATSMLAYADIWTPLTTNPSYYNDWSNSNGQSMLYVEDPSKHAAVREELYQAVEEFAFNPNPDVYKSIAVRAWTPLQTLATELIEEFSSPGFGDFDAVAANYSIHRVPEFLAVASVAVLLFMSLPAINMANLNIGRILERAPEIGLRKSAGASRRVLAGQFIFENVVVSMLGGLVALALAPILLWLLNDTLITYGQLKLNGPVFVAAFVFVLVFGVLSGAYPAWKMARLEPAAALRGSQHV
jgi:putative ABC transport system permease protein